MLRTILQGFSPFRLPNFRIYISGQAVSLIGTWLQATAQAWVVWELSHSEAALGIVSMLGALPVLLMGPWVGVLADRVNRRSLLIFTQAGMMLLAFSLAFLTQLGLTQLWHVYVLSLLLGVMTALDFPAQQTFLGDLAGMGEVRKAINLNAMFFQASRIIGPALAGWVIAALGASMAFWLNGLSFLAVIASLAAVRVQQAERPPRRTSVGADLREGLHFLRGQPRIQDLLALSLLVTLLGFSILNMMPAIASEVLGGDAGTLGTLMAASGAGAFTCTVFFLPLAQSRKHVGRIMALVVMWMGVWYIALSFARWLPLAMLCLYAFSIGAPLVVAMSLGLIQVLTPLEMRARLVSLFTMISFGMQPLSSLLVGASAERFGVVAVVLVNGCLLVLGGAGMLFLRRGLRQWEVQAAAGPAAPGGH